MTEIQRRSIRGVEMRALHRRKGVKYLLENQ